MIQEDQALLMYFDNALMRLASEAMTYETQQKLAVGSWAFSAAHGEACAYPRRGVGLESHCL